METQKLEVFLAPRCLVKEKQKFGELIQFQLLVEMPYIQEFVDFQLRMKLKAVVKRLV